jgi:DNA-binding transcriptional ArsR family regulator
MNVFTAIADPTRRRMLELLTDGERTVSELAAAFPQASQPLISAHLRTLREAQLVEVRAEAQRRIYSLRPQGLEEIDRWIGRYRRFWKRQLDDLERHLDANPD